MHAITPIQSQDSSLLQCWLQRCSQHRVVECNMTNVPINQHTQQLVHGSIYGTLPKTLQATRASGKQGAVCHMRASMVMRLCQALGKSPGGGFTLTTAGCQAGA